MAQEKTSKQRHIEHLEICTGCEYCDLLREVYTECDMCGGWDLIESPEWKIIDGDLYCSNCVNRTKRNGDNKMTALEIKLKAYEVLINNIGHLIDDGGFEATTFKDESGPYIRVTFKIGGIEWYCLAHEYPQGSIITHAFSMNEGQKIDDFVKSVKAIQMKTKKELRNDN